MTRFKVKAPYSRWIDELSLKEKIFINDGIAGIHLAKKIKHSLPPNQILCESIAHNRFLLMNLSKKPLHKIETLGDYSYYDL